MINIWKDEGTRALRTLYIHTFANSADGLCSSKSPQKKRRVRPLRDRLTAIEQTVSQLLQGRGALLSVRNCHDLSSAVLVQPTLFAECVFVVLLLLLFLGTHMSWQALLPWVSSFFSEAEKTLPPSPPHDCVRGTVLTTVVVQRSKSHI